MKLKELLKNLEDQYGDSYNDYEVLAINILDDCCEIILTKDYKEYKTMVF